MTIPLSLAWLAAGAALTGLAIGSFLNVVAHRLPRMLERRWAQECADFATPADTPPDADSTRASTDAPFNLAVPRSHCPHCGHTLAWHENIPLLSWLWQRGRCSACRAPIGWHYPVVEALTALWFVACVLHWPDARAAVLWAGFGAALITLSLIDWQTTYLPDEINQPLLWCGLMGAALAWSGTRLPDALWGAVAGYLSLWVVCRGFEWITGRIGMGEGDFKLLAAIGAWAGWQALLPVVLLASVAGVVAGLLMKSRGALREGGYLPFGPFLALAGMLVSVGMFDESMRWLGLLP